jgi:hypothetical protein
VSSTKAGIAKDSFDAGSLKLVMAGSGCENAEKVKQVEIVSCYMNCFIENNVPILLLISC